MQMFNDSKLKNEIIDDFDLGIVDVGKFKTYEYYIVNEGIYDLVDLIVSSISGEIEIIHAPIQIKAHTSAKIIFKWTPSVTIKKGLKANLLFKANEIVTP